MWITLILICQMMIQRNKCTYFCRLQQTGVEMKLKCSAWQVMISVVISSLTLHNIELKSSMFPQTPADDDVFKHFLPRVPDLSELSRSEQRQDEIRN